MGCPRCGGALAEFTLGDNQSTYCEACGWVGIDVELSPDDSPPSDDSQPDAMEGGRQPVDQGQTAASPVASSGTDGSDAGGLPPETRTLLGIEASQADRLDDAGIGSVDALAAADPDELADAVDGSTEEVRLWIRRASIMLVTDDGE